MEKQRFLILSVAEAKEALAKFFANHLVSNPANTLEMILESKLHIGVPDVMNMPDDKVANLYADLCLGEDLLRADSAVDMVAVQTGDYRYEMVAMRGQLYPKEERMKNLVCYFGGWLEIPVDEVILVDPDNLEVKKTAAQWLEEKGTIDGLILASFADTVAEAKTDFDELTLKIEEE